MSTELAKQLKKRLKEKGMSIAALERQAGLKPDTARNIIRGISRNPRASNLQAIADVLGCHLPQLLGAPSTSPMTYTSQDVHLEHPCIFQEIVQHVLNNLKNMPSPPSLQTLYTLFTELYMDAIQRYPIRTDPAFIQWFITKRLNKYSIVHY